MATWRTTVPGRHLSHVHERSGDALAFLESEWNNEGDTFDLGLERDQIALNNHGEGTFTIPAWPMRRRLQGLERFIVSRGGKYVFVPGLTALRWPSSILSMPIENRDERPASPSVAEPHPRECSK